MQTNFNATFNNFRNTLSTAAYANRPHRIVHVIYPRVMASKWSIPTVLDSIAFGRFYWFCDYTVAYEDPIDF